MKVKTLTNVTLVCCTLLSLSIGLLLLNLNNSVKAERISSAKNLQLVKLGQQLKELSDFLTREARRYTIHGDKKHFDAFWHEVNIAKNRDQVVNEFKKLGANTDDLLLIEEAKKRSDLLIQLENKSMQAVQDGDLQRAQNIMFGSEYDTNKQLILEPINLFQKNIIERSNIEKMLATKKADSILFITTILIVSYLLFVFIVVYFVFIRGSINPLLAISKSMNRVSKGKHNVTIPYSNHNNEIGALARSAKNFQEVLKDKAQLTEDLELHKNNLALKVNERTQELQLANNELEQFAYRTSHDLRSPIISIRKLLEIADLGLKKDQFDRAKMSIDLAKDSAIDLENLLEDIINLHKTNVYKEEYEDIKLKNVIKNTINTFSHMENYPKVNWEIEVTDELQLTSKLSRITIIVENLLSNAIKYLDKNKDENFIKIHYSEGEFFNQITIDDNGIGIPQEQHKNLFKMFKRFHPEMAFGSGLGLYIVKKSVDHLGGNITYMPTQVGSRFVIELPIKPKDN